MNRISTRLGGSFIQVGLVGGFGTLLGGWTFVGEIFHGFLVEEGFGLEAVVGGEFLELKWLGLGLELIEGGVLVGLGLLELLEGALVHHEVGLEGGGLGELGLGIGGEAGFGVAELLLVEFFGLGLGGRERVAEVLVVAPEAVEVLVELLEVLVELLQVVAVGLEVIHIYGNLFLVAISVHHDFS